MRAALKEINLFYLLIGICSSFAWFFILWRTAYQWPAMDMLPFFERQANPSYLLNDFYTNAISQAPNPRYVFGYSIIALATLFNVNYYEVCYALKVALVLIFPVLYYLIVFVYSKKHLPTEKSSVNQLLILFFVFMVMYPRVSNFFSIAWWNPYNMQAQPQNLALLLGFIAILLKESGKSFVKGISVILLACATAIHPAIGLFLVALLVLLNFDELKTNITYYSSVAIIGLALPIACITVFFGPQSPVDVRTFIEIYIIQNHPAHYHVADFGSFTALSWKFSYATMLLLLAVPAYFFYKNKNNKALLLALLFLLATLAVVICQYVFIDIIPVKFVASAGPVRFTIFTYWLIVIVWTILLSGVHLPLQDFKTPKLKPVVVLVSMGVLWVVGLYAIDSPKKEAFDKDKDLYTFLRTTDPGSVYAAYFGNYTTDIPNIGERAVFIGNGFPFNESYFIEHETRRALLYGNKTQIANMEGKWIGDKFAAFFRTLPPSHFRKIAETYRLDYVVIEADYATAFNAYQPVFANSKIKIFNVNHF